MKRYISYVMLIGTIVTLFFQAMEYNKLSIVDNNSIVQVNNETTEKEDEKEKSLKDFKESIEDEFIEIKEIATDEKSYRTTIEFKGNYIDLLEYINKVNEKKLKMKNFKLTGELEEIVATMNLE